MMFHSRSQGTEVMIVTGDVFPTDDNCVDGAKDVRTSSSARAPPTELVERYTEKHNILLSFKKKKTIDCSFQTGLCLRLFLWRYFNDKCPERITVI